jgi:alpha-galactosidase
MKTTTTIPWAICFLATAVFRLAIPCLGAGDAAMLTRAKAPGNAIFIDTMDMDQLNRVGGPVRAGLAYYGQPMALGAKVYRHGLGANGDSFVAIDLKGGAKRFLAEAGINADRRNSGSVVFQVWLDSKKVMETGVLRGGDKPQLIDVDLTGAKRLFLVTNSAGDGSSDDFADWGGALLFLDPAANAAPVPLDNPKDYAAPAIAHADPNAYGIHGPRIVGTTPGLPFVFRVPATGKGPLKFTAKNLPDGLTLDPKTGVITGSVKKAGETMVALSVSGPKGKATRKLKIVAGAHKLALTPPLGWNSWNVWGLAVNDAKVRQAADVMVRSGLAAHGFAFVNIDDGWEKNRAADGTIVTNEKFPDMKSTAGYVHSLGLKFGIYSSPGPKTCGRYEASYQHEYQDAASYAAWGVDYLKYDWCSYGEIVSAKTRADYQAPYILMRDALDKSGRDIVFSLCQYGMDNVWEWGAEIGGNLWRTTGDINDSWGSLSGIGFSQTGHERYAGPGHWNDPDMLVVGNVGWGPSVHPSRLSPNEQLTHITLWSLLAAPMLLGADMGNLDAFTIDLLTNDEVLDVNQDPLGKQAGRVAQYDMTEVMARPLWDGTVAVGLFNRFFERADVTVKWSDLGIKGSQPVRDLWQRKNLGTFKDSFKASVPAHGVVFIKIGKPKRTDW